MEFPPVTIIVPMYNAAGCIARCVKSICAQSYKKHPEIILLNDGSNRYGTLSSAVLLPLRTIASRWWTSLPGAADTRNQGIALAHGKYIQFVDSDDWLAPDFTEKLVSAAEAHTADLVIAPFWMVYPKGLCGAHSPMGKGAGQRAPAQSAPHPGLWLSACRGVHRAGVRPAADPKSPIPFTTVCCGTSSTAGTSAGHGIRPPAGAVCVKISCSTPNICVSCTLPFPSRTSATAVSRTARASPTPE